MCTINKSAHTKKGLETYLMILVYRFFLVVIPLLVHVKGYKEYVTYEFVLTSPVEARISGSSNLDSFRVWW